MTTPEQFIFQEKAIATLVKMLCENSGSAAARRDKTCLAALNSEGKKLVTQGILYRYLQFLSMYFMKEKTKHVVCTTL